MTKQKLPLILVSGGFDSLYLLETRLKEGPVDILFINTGQYQLKIEAERASINAAIAILEKRYGHKVRNHYDEFIVNSNLIKRFKFAQPLGWLTGALRKIDDEIHSSLEIGYIMGDQINSWLGDIVGAWNHLQTFTVHGHVDLLFPLRENTKQQILTNLSSELAAVAWTCEIPVGTPEGSKSRYRHCGVCDSCNTLWSNIALYQKRIGYKYSSHIASIAAELPYATDAHLLYDTLKFSVNDLPVPTESSQLTEIASESINIT